MSIHSNAQKELAIAFHNVMGRPPTPNERLFMGAIAYGESTYSTARFYNKQSGESKVLNNWGAIQCPSKERPCPAGSFEVSDIDVHPDGSETPFNQCYCDDATRELAAERFVRTLYQHRPQLLAAATMFPKDALEQLLALPTVADHVDEQQPLYDGKETVVSLRDPYYLHIAWFSHVMRDSKYFGLRLKKHIGAQIRYHLAIGKAIGEYVDGSGPMANPKEPAGDTDPGLSLEQWLSLWALQWLEDAANGTLIRFGPHATKVIKAYQSARGLKVDGVVGKETLGSVVNQKP